MSSSWPLLRDYILQHAAPEQQEKLDGEETEGDGQGGQGLRWLAACTSTVQCHWQGPLEAALAVDEATGLWHLSADAEVTTLPYIQTTPIICRVLARQLFCMLGIKGLGCNMWARRSGCEVKEKEAKRQLTNICSSYMFETWRTGHWHLNKSSSRGHLRATLLWVQLITEYSARLENCMLWEYLCECYSHVPVKTAACSELLVKVMFLTVRKTVRKTVRRAEKCLDFQPHRSFLL